MKVTHIIPSAFEYFDDIRERTFSWVEELSKLGVDIDVFTLQYERPTPAVKLEISDVAPSRTYSHTGSIKTMTETIIKMAPPASELEIIHLHTPFLGGAAKIMEFIKSRQSTPLVITHHRPVQLVNLFSVGLGQVEVFVFGVMRA